jgi:putative FmdB family regulatory protein
MPIYEYECEQCGVRFEKTQRFTDTTLTECPECNGHVHRVMQPVGVIFKGSGFYVTDYRSDSYKEQKKKESGEKPKAKDEGGKKPRRSSGDSSSHSS